MKAISEEPVYLKGSSYYITQNENDAFRVVSGKVYVYIVPWSESGIGRRTLLCQVSENGMIPAFAYRDLDYQHWRFCLVAEDEAAVLRLPDMLTSPLKKRFLDNAIKDVRKESFENALVDYYHMSLVKEDAYLIRTKREKTQTREKIDQLILTVFQKKMPEKKQEGSQLLYSMMAVLCHRAKISIAPYDKVQVCCGKHITALDIARISHFPCREVVLEEGWYRTDAGSLLVYFGEKEEPAACVPRGRSGYLLYRNGQKPVRLTSIMCPKFLCKYYPSFCVFTALLPRNIFT